MGGDRRGTITIVFTGDGIGGDNRLVIAIAELKTTGGASGELLMSHEIVSAGGTTL